MLIEKEALSEKWNKFYDIDETGTSVAVKAVLLEEIKAAPEAVVRCKDCKLFVEYTEEYQQKVEKADGDCSVRVWFSNYERFCGVQYDDYCSLAKRKVNT